VARNHFENLFTFWKTNPRVLRSGPVNVAAVTDYSLLEQVLAGNQISCLGSKVSGLEFPRTRDPRLETINKELLW
jgi:hypothetical protein